MAIHIVGFQGVAGIAAASAACDAGVYYVDQVSEMNESEMAAALIYDFSIRAKSEGALLYGMMIARELLNPIAAQLSARAYAESKAL
jgi:hypothetical protein